MTTTHKHVGTLERLLTHLQRRINEWDEAIGNPAARARMKHERNALLWALPVLREKVGLADDTTIEQWEVIATVAESEIAKVKQRQRERQAQLDAQMGMVAP